MLSLFKHLPSMISGDRNMLCWSGAIKSKDRSIRYLAKRKELLHQEKMPISGKKTPQFRRLK